MRVTDAINPLRFAQMDAETRFPITESVGSGCLNLETRSWPATPKNATSKSACHKE